MKHRIFPQMSPVISQLKPGGFTFFSWHAENASPEENYKEQFWLVARRGNASVFWYQNTCTGLEQGLVGYREPGLHGTAGSDMM